MTFKDLCSKIAKIEGKKNQARIGEVREILSILSLLMAQTQDLDIVTTLVNNGKRLAKRK